MKQNISIILLSTLILFFIGCGAVSFSSLKDKADAGDAKYQYAVGLKYFQGSEDVKQDKKLGIAYLKKAADQNYPIAIHDLGNAYYKEKKYVEAVKYYKLAVDQNYTTSKIALGDMYQRGLGVKKDALKAIKLYKSAYEDGRIIGMLGVATSYMDLKKYNETINSYKIYINHETSRDVPYKIKSQICFDLMELYYKLGQIDSAYLWGATGILAGGFGSTYDDFAKDLNIFENVNSKITNDKKQKAAKDIIKMHYEYFTRYEYYIKKHSELKFKHSLIYVDNMKLIAVSTYLISKNQKLYNTITYLKDKKDENSQLNLAIFHGKYASEEIKLGTIFANYYFAQSDLKDSLKILNKYNDKSLNTIKKVLNEKLFILKLISTYQDKMYKLYYHKKRER